MRFLGADWNGTVIPNGKWMTSLGSAADEKDQKVWRYLTFSRFVWLLQRRQLWLARADTLDDRWEIALAGDQLAYVISRHPPTTLPLSGDRQESAMERVQRIIPMWRQKTFVSCWNCSEDESHALWRVYCGAIEGVAIQSTLGRLRNSAAPLPVLPIEYGAPGSKRQTPTPIDLATQKRRTFAYEQEVRIVQTYIGDDATAPPDEALGRCLEWEPETYIDSIWVHPDAAPSFMETVAATVKQYAPILEDRIEWSAMRGRPPA